MFTVAPNRRTEIMQGKCTFANSTISTNITDLTHFLCLKWLNSKAVPVNKL